MRRRAFADRCVRTVRCGNAPRSKSRRVLCTHHGHDDDGGRSRADGKPEPIERANELRLGADRAYAVLRLYLAYRNVDRPRDVATDRRTHSRSRSQAQQGVPTSPPCATAAVSKVSGDAAPAMASKSANTMRAANARVPIASVCVGSAPLAIEWNYHGARSSPAKQCCR